MAIELKQIRQVEALARHGNFARAAIELQMTQPGLSRAIQNLEQQLGLKLFDRGMREVVPTVYGRHIIRFGATLVQDAARLERDLLLIKGQDAGELVIGTGPIPAETIIGETIGRLAQLHPKLHIRIIVERPPALFIMLKQREIDVMVADTRGLELTDDIAETLLPQHPFCFIGRTEHPLSRQAVVRLADIFNYPIAAPWLPVSIFSYLSQKLGLEADQIARFENGLIECNNFTLLIEVVRQSDAVGCGLTSIFAQAVAAGKIVVLPVESFGLSSQYRLLHLKRYSASPALDIFTTLLLETAHRQDGAQG